MSTFIVYFIPLLSLGEEKIIQIVFVVVVFLNVNVDYLW